MGIQTEAGGVAVGCGEAMKEFLHKTGFILHGPRLFHKSEPALVSGKQGMNWVLGAEPTAQVEGLLSEL